MALTGCELTEPYDRIGTWRPSHSMDANIAVSAVNPSDLVRGVDYQPRDASATTRAVERYRAGRVRALPSAGTFDTRGGGGAPQAGDNGGGASTGTAAQ